MTPLDRFEVKAASFSVGLGLLILALTIFTGPPDSLFIMAIYSAGLGVWWGAPMLGIGLMLMFASIRPHREARHQALAAAMLICFVTFTTFLWWGRVTFPSMLILWMGLMALASFLVDVCGHAKIKREKTRKPDAARTDFHPAK